MITTDYRTTIILTIINKTIPMITKDYRTTIIHKTIIIMIIVILTISFFNKM